MADENIYGVVLQLYAGILIGWLCVRFNLVQPKSGHMEGISFYVGKIALPLVIFKDAAAIDFQNLRLVVIAACNLGKVCVGLCTGLFAYWSMCARRPRMESFRIAALYSFFAVSSNDFLIGYPLFGVLFPSGSQMDACAYLTLNAVINVTIYLALTVVLLEVGAAYDNETGITRQRGARRRIIKNIVTNPLFAAGLLGLLYGFFVNKGSSSQLPAGLRDVVSLLTGPFSMMALFMTGASIGSFKFSRWLLILAFMKVVLVACASFAFTLWLFPAGAVPEGAEAKALGTFTFFYGSLPTSSAPIILAKIFGIGHDVCETMAGAILVSIVIAFPQMIVGLVFTKPDQVTGVLRLLHLSLAYSSATLSLLTIVILMQVACALTCESSAEPIVSPPTSARTSSHAVGCTRIGLFGISSYAFVVLLYCSASAILINFGCPFDMDSTALSMAFGGLQHVCCIMPICLLVGDYVHWALKSHQICIFGVGIVAMGTGSSAFATPYLLDEICGSAFERSEVWPMCLLSCILLFMYGCFFINASNRTSQIFEDSLLHMNMIMKSLAGFFCLLFVLKLTNLAMLFFRGRVLTVLLILDVCMDAGQGVFLLVVMLQFKDVWQVLHDCSRRFCCKKDETNPTFPFSSWDIADRDADATQQITGERLADDRSFSRLSGSLRNNDV